MSEGEYSHLDFSETAKGNWLYQDRTAMKYYGFILSEHHDQMKNRISDRLVERTILDEQEMEEIQFHLQEACRDGQPVSLTVFEKTSYRSDNLYDFTRYEDKGEIIHYQQMTPISFDYMQQKVRFEQEGHLFVIAFQDILSCEVL
ncbi:YolD-like family protein [Listeria ilorinensis]|uniref:YolD-like family protein n=1 Tax=Listeria ilorinensis TaxID=2867439 RepID=UPI001EF6B8C1|nr:YolD-like family protein [Listeria ilorinensis]